MKKVIMGIGIPGSGKTTILKSFADKYSYTYISPDDLRKKITGDIGNQTKNKEIWEEAYRLVADELSRGNSVVFDATFVNKNERENFIRFAKDRGALKVEGIFLDVPFEIAKERNLERDRNVPEHAMDRMERNLREFPPEITDGFDSIFTLDEEHILREVELQREDKVIHKEFKELH